MDRKESIIVNARKQFSRFGYSKTTMDNIARQAEITKPTLYQYYAGKADLFAAVIDYEQNIFFGRVRRAISDIRLIGDKLRVYCHLKIDSLADFLLLGELSKRAFLDLHPEALRALTAAREKEEILLAEWITQGIDTSEFSPVNARHAAGIFTISVASLIFETLVIHNIQSDEIIPEEEQIKQLRHRLDVFIHLFLNGLNQRETLP